MKLHIMQIFSMLKMRFCPRCWFGFAIRASKE